MIETIKIGGCCDSCAPKPATQTVNKCFEASGKIRVDLTEFLPEGHEVQSVVSVDVVDILIPSTSVTGILTTPTISPNADGTNVFIDLMGIANAGVLNRTYLVKILLNSDTCLLYTSPSPRD